MKVFINLVLCLFFAANSFAAGTSVTGTLYLNNTSLITFDGLLRDKGTWSGTISTNYSIGDVVQYLGSSYVAVQASNNQTPLNNTSYWTLLATSGSNGLSPDVVSENAGANCTNGGLKITVGAGLPKYVCNGAAGAAGQVNADTLCASIIAANMELPSFCTNPSKFSMAWLSGKTLYQVWFGNGLDGNGGTISNVPVVHKLVFGANGIVQGTGLLNMIDRSGSYNVDGNGSLYFAGYSTSLNTIVPSGTSRYIKTYYTGNGVFDGVDLFFFDEAAAMLHAKQLTGPVPL